MTEITEDQILNAVRVITSAYIGKQKPRFSIANIVEVLHATKASENTRRTIAAILRKNGYKVIKHGQNRYYTYEGKPKKIIAVDYDGTISTNAFPNLGTIRPGAKKCLQWLREEGHIIVINTCRAGTFADEAKANLTKLHIPFDYFNENTREKINEYGFDVRKISADIYIDDKNLDTLAGNGIDWKDIREKLEKIL